MSELRSAIEGLRAETLPELPDARIEEDFAELQRALELLDDALGLPAARGGGLPTQGDRRAPQALHVAEQLGALGLFQDVAQQGGEEANVAPERCGDLGHGPRVARPAGGPGAGG